MKKSTVWVCNTLYGTSRDTKFLSSLMRLVLVADFSPLLNMKTKFLVDRVALPKLLTSLPIHTSPTTTEVLSMIPTTLVLQISVTTLALRWFTGMPMRLVVNFCMLLLLLTLLLRFLKLLVWWSLYLHGPNKVLLSVSFRKMKLKEANNLLWTNTITWRN